MTRDVTTFKAYGQIRRQPEELARLLDAPEPITKAADLFGKANRIFTVGTGTSYNAALTAAYWLRLIGCDASAWTAYDFAVYGPGLRPGDGAIVYSHTGRKQYSQRSLERLQAAGLPSVWITAQNPDVTNPASVTLHTVTRETSPMFTVSHTAAMLLTARLVEHLRPDSLGDLRAVPDAVRTGLTLEPTARELARAWKHTGSIIAVGGGPHEASAWEVAIKLNEGPRMRAHGYSIEQFLHGPQVQMQTEDALIIYANPGAALERTRAVAQFALDIGAPVAWVAPTEGPAGVKALTVVDVGERLAPIVQAVPGQLLAAHLAAERDIDCDSFRRDDPAFKRAYERYTL
jgi:glucosamine 6-phosphate synthetase-like amidotransferase/phosphosugar isomerase protein